MNFSKALRDRWVQAQLLLLAVTGTLGPVLDRAGPPPVRAMGVALLLLGLGFAIWGARALGAALTPEPEPVADARLVESGPYRLVRHPIYTGVVLAVSGWTLAWSTWLVALGVGIVLLAFFTAKAGAEERWLRERFPAYGEYARRVRRKVLW